ncbi:MAG TPA: hypothetical protein PK955_10425, partial [Methanoregulaceae archaeon]|nr:hypothetical protein [Methanoregulaceae archaeon]
MFAPVTLAHISDKDKDKFAPTMGDRLVAVLNREDGSGFLAAADPYEHPPCGGLIHEVGDGLRHLLGEQVPEHETGHLFPRIS